MGAVVATASPTSSSSPPPSSSTVVSYNPATGHRLGEVPVQSADEVRAAVARARVAQRAWGELPVRERARRVLGLRDLIIKRADELCEAISLEGGKTTGEALSMEVM